jgi:hypothetical protein
MNMHLCRSSNSRESIGGWILRDHVFCTFEASLLTHHESFAIRFIDCPLVHDSFPVSVVSYALSFDFDATTTSSYRRSPFETELLLPLRDSSRRSLLSLGAAV